MALQVEAYRYHQGRYGASTVVQRDLADNHRRDVARSYIKELSDAIGAVVQAKEETWHYATPALDEPVATVDSPDTNITGAITVLPDNLFKVKPLQKTFCDRRYARNKSTFYVREAPVQMDPNAWVNQLGGNLFEAGAWYDDDPAQERERSSRMGGSAEFYPLAGAAPLVDCE